MSLRIYRPFFLKAFNASANLVSFNPKLSVDDLIRSARKETKLSEFNDDSFLEPLNVLVQSINNEARLHTIGKLITKIRLKNILSNRLRVEEYIRKHPECLEEEISPIILITGLQRTGTTKLHRLLASNPQIRYLKSWEVLNPVPLKQADNSDRIKASKLSEKALKYMSPDFFAIHPVEYNAPEEEVLLLDMQFLSTVAEATMHVPTYSVWNQKQDQTPAYQYMKRAIKVLQHQKKNKYWVMKSPHHLEFLDVFAKVFPETKIIQTHRNPIQTLASFCSMVYFSRAIFSDEISPNEIAKHWSNKVEIMLKRSMEFRDSSDAVIVDVNYHNLVENSSESISKMYSELGLSFESDDLKRIEEVEKSNTQHKYGVHKYQLSDFGLTEEVLKNRYSFYLERFIE